MATRHAAGRIGRHGDVATRPYAACWRGQIGALWGTHGVLSVHTTPRLAKLACIRVRDQLRPIWGAYQPWWAYSVVDRRTGAIIETITR